MLKRITLIDTSEDLRKEAEKVIENMDVQLVEITKGEDVPVATAAVVAGSDTGTALEAALVIGNRQEEILNILAEAFDCREGMMPGSSKRLQEHATRFAKALKLTVDDQLILERAALIRDIGKIRIPNETLLKDGVLDYDEWMTLQCHSKYGAEIIREYEVFDDLEEIICCHHECYDGTGYPKGLEGDDIPFLARIMKILDVYCAMTSPRHYRKGHATRKEAIKHLKSEREKHFDPDLIDVFIKDNVGQS